MTFKRIETRDSTTESMVKQAKLIMNLVKHRMEIFNPTQRKYFKDLQDFVDLYDFGKIKVWSEFFMTANEMRDKYDKRTNEEARHFIQPGNTK